MTGKTDVRVRPHLTFSVTTYEETDNAGASREVASGMTSEAANEIAKAVHNASDTPRHLTYFEVEATEHNLYRETGPEWLQNVDAQLSGRGEGSLILIERLAGSRIRVLTARARTYTGRPQPVEPLAAHGNMTWIVDNPLDGRLTQVEAVVANLKNTILKEVSRLNLPERWDDLSRETTKRGLETFMAVQAAAKAHWPDHEIEALINNIQKRTGKDKLGLRQMFERAQEKARAALAEVEQTVKDRDPLAPIVTLTNSASAADIKAAVKTVLETGYKPMADELIQAISGATGHRSGAFLLWVKEVLEELGGDALTEREEAYCRHRSTGMKPIAAAKAAGYAEDSAHTLESTATIRRVITAMMAEKPQADVGSGAGTNGSWRLENATQEFFALNVGFYGMTVEVAATQMSLPLATAEGLMQMPSVSARIAFFQRCRAAGAS